jgi:hypothetical protein
MSSWDTALWDVALWDDTRPIVNLGLLDKILTEMEQYSGIETVSDHVCEPGMDTIKSPFKTLINDLEKK